MMGMVKKLPGKVSGVCPTCAAVEAILAATRRVPRPVARAVGYSGPVRKVDRLARTTKAVRTVSDYQKKLGKHLKIEKKKAIKKNGDFKKGKNMSTVMRAAHKCVKKELRRSS